MNPLNHTVRFAQITMLGIVFGLVTRSATAESVQPPNILVLVADDFGVDLVSAYGEGSAPACTPNIDGLASEGLLFRNAWAYPTCSPTRSALLTGRYGFRTGVGTVLEPSDPGLPLAEVTIPEMLAAYDTTAVGKWHISGDLGNAHPNDSGFMRYAGAIGGGIPDYDLWRKVTDGQSAQVDTYATIETAEDAIAAMETMEPPWFLHVAFNAPHSPWHVPPADVCSAPSCPTTSCGNVTVESPTSSLVKAMSEGMDHEIGRILAALDLVDPNTIVVFLGDNGTARQATEPPFDRNHAKGTLYEGGVNVPLIVRGPGVTHGECAGLVSVTDLYATFAELSGADSTADDSVSLAPYFADPSLALRDTVYSETFTPNGVPTSSADHQQAIRDARYKLIRRSGEADEFYDLARDPFETTNLLPELSVDEQAAYDTLASRITALFDTCPVDTNADRQIDFTDLLAVIAAWGPCAAPCGADADGDGEVGFTELVDVLSAWGPC